VHGSDAQVRRDVLRRYARFEAREPLLEACVTLFGAQAEKLVPALGFVREREPVARDSRTKALVRSRPSLITK
jgi:hypothetical protein